MSAASGGQVASTSVTEEPPTVFLEMHKNVVHILVDCVEVPALVDTGATVSVMSDDLRKRLNKLVTPYNSKPLRGVGNGVLCPVGVCTSRIEISGYLVPVSFVILPLCSHDIILGIDFLREHAALISCRPGELAISPFPPADYWDSTNVCSMSGNLSLQHATIISPSSGVWLSVVSSMARKNPVVVHVVAEMNRTVLLQKNVASPTSLVTLESGHTSIWAVNFGYQACRLPAGLVVASFCESANFEEMFPLSEDAQPATTQESVHFIDDKLKHMLDDNLTAQQRLELLEIVRVHQNLFDIQKQSTGCALNVKHSIDTEGHSPIRQRPYRVSRHEREIIQEQVDDMLRSDVVRQSTSPWASPVVLVRKKDNTWRFCVDYRKLNKVTKKDTYPLPRIDDALDTLEGSKYFSSLDMKSGYWQIEVDHRDREKTAFVTPDGLFEFQVMPFGLCNAPATFERMIDNVLGKLKWTSCLCYLDDIVVFGKSFPEHNLRLERVLACLGQAGLVLNSQKCNLGCQELTILGHLVNAEGVRPDPKKISAVIDFPRPHTLKQVRSFLGLCSYFRRFVPNYSSKSQPLQDLLKKGTKFVWETHQEHSFSLLKNELTSCPLLRHFEPGAPVELHTDASASGIGAVLIQRVLSEEHPVAYASRSLTDAERNYSTTENECLAVVWGITKFRPYLYGRHFSVVTDHSALCWLANIKSPSGRLARWALQLQEYDYEIVYRSGRKHQDADALSRAPLELSAHDQEKDDLPLAVLEDTDIAAEQASDPLISNIIRSLRDPSRYTTRTRKHVSNYELRDGVLYKANFDPTGRPYLLVVPRCCRLDVLKALHDDPTSGHLGFVRTFHRVSSRFYWPRMRRSVTKYLRGCPDCQKRKHEPLPPAGSLQSIPPSPKPFHRVGIDLLGPFPSSVAGNRWVIVCIDYQTRYAETKATPSGTAVEIAAFLIEQIILRHGAPRELLSDRGTAFMSHVIQQLMQRCRTIHRTTTSYHPQCNGLTERLNRTLCDMLSMYVDADHRNWDEILPFVTFAYNTSRQDTTTFSPFFLVYARECDTLIDSLLPYVSNPTCSDYVTEMVSRAEESRQLARTFTLVSQQRQQAVYDKKHRNAMFSAGDLVWVWKPERKVGLSEKLLRRYFGPYRILRQISPVNYVVKLLSPSHSQRAKEETVHVVRLKPYHPPATML